MAQNAGAQRYLSTRDLCFLVLLICLQMILTSTYTASLCYRFTVDKSGSGPRRQVQGQLNKEPFIYCDNNNSCHAIGHQKSILSATKIWQQQIKTLKDAGDQFIAVVAHLKAENSIMRGTEPLILQATMHCGHEANGDFRAFWDFGLNGRKRLHFDSSTRKLTEADSESSQLKSMLEEVTDFLYWSSQGDCMSWLKEFTLPEPGKLEPTGLVKESTCVSTSASTITAPDVNQPRSLASKPNISVLLMILTCSLLFLLQYL